MNLTDAFTLQVNFQITLGFRAPTMDFKVGGGGGGLKNRVICLKMLATMVEQQRKIWFPESLEWPLN